MVASLEKFRATQHRLVEKMMVLDSVEISLAVMPDVAKGLADLTRAVGRLTDHLERMENETGELSRRVVRLEANSGKRI
jgi:hypothetical protein